MTPFELPVFGHVSAADTSSIVLSLAVIAVVYSIGSTIWLALFSPLAKFPGPRLRAWSKIPLIRTMVTGHDNSVYPSLHKQYGPVVRIGPNELSFASGHQAWQDIYGFKR
ncbi:hypothetical protein LTR53_008644, partial [Teratosphaeriaceae sp. CCFEE 6253]